MDLAPNLLPLAVVVPMIAAAIACFIRAVPVLRTLTFLTVSFSTLSGVVLAVVHSDPATRSIATAVGGYPDGFAIPFVSDMFVALMMVTIGITSGVILWFATLTGEDRLRYFLALALLLLAGVNGALMTGDLFNLFVFIEVMLLPSYALMAMAGAWRRIGVSRTFVVINLTTSAILLMGIGWVYAAAGTVNLASLYGAGVDDPAVGLAVGVVLAALAVKAGVAPAHSWLPRTYPGTSATVMALFSVMHTKVAIYAIYRITSVVYDGNLTWAGGLIVLVGATVLIGGYGSLGESNIRRVLSWQMVNGVGLILLGILLFTPFAWSAGIVYMLHHMVSMACLLLASGAIEHTYGTGRFEGLTGLMRRDKLLAWITALGLMSLIGLPPSSGFIGKLGLVRATLTEQNLASWIVVGVILLGSLGTLVASARLWDDVFWGKPMPGSAAIPRSLVLPAGALLLVSLAMFAGAGPLWAMADQAGAGLVDVTSYVGAVLP